jgi:plastocyanin
LGAAAARPRDGVGTLGAMSTTQPTFIAIARGAVVAVAAAAVIAACSPAVEAPVSFNPDSPQLTAKGNQFDTTELDVPGDSGFDLVLHNEDPIQHNVSIYADESHTQRLFAGDFANQGTHVYHVQSLAPGTYYFECDIHPTMNGIVVAANG